MLFPIVGAVTDMRAKIAGAQRPRRHEPAIDEKICCVTFEKLYGK
ncbi:MAG: hypothetical protein ACREQ2_22030 [Candidatus Binatia bacterium]